MSGNLHRNQDKYIYHKKRELSGYEPVSEITSLSCMSINTALGSIELFETSCSKFVLIKFISDSDGTEFHIAVFINSGFLSNI